MGDQPRDADEYVPDDDDDEDDALYALAGEQLDRQMKAQEQPEPTAYGIAASHVNLEASYHTSNDPSFRDWAPGGTFCMAPLTLPHAASC